MEILLPGNLAEVMRDIYRRLGALERSPRTSSGWAVDFNSSIYQRNGDTDSWVDSSPASPQITVTSLTGRLLVIYGAYLEMPPDSSVMAIKMAYSLVGEGFNLQPANAPNSEDGLTLPNGDKTGVLVYHDEAFTLSRRLSTTKIDFIEGLKPGEYTLTGKYLNDDAGGGLPDDDVYWSRRVLAAQGL